MVSFQGARKIYRARYATTAANVGFNSAKTKSAWQLKAAALLIGSGRWRRVTSAIAGPLSRVCIFSHLRLALVPPFTLSYFDGLLHISHFPLVLAPLFWGDLPLLFFFSFFSSPPDTLPVTVVFALLPGGKKDVLFAVPTISSSTSATIRPSRQSRPAAPQPLLSE